MTPSREDSRVDWGLFLLVLVGAQGYAGFFPVDPSRLLLVISGVVLSFLVIRDLDSALSAFLSSPLVLFMAAWLAIASMLSARPLPSLYAAGVLTLLVVYTRQRQSTIEKTLHTFTLAATVSLVPSLVGRVIPLGVPVLERAGSAGGYAGYFPFNSAAGLCAGTVLLGVVALFISGASMWWHVPALGGAMVVILLANSATTYISLAATAGVVLGITAITRASAKTRPLVIVGIAIGLLLGAPALGRIAVLPTLADATGRDPTLSKRTDIWELAIAGVRESPLFGFGSGFWNSRNWNSGQNGFLDVALIGGVPAALAVIAMIIAAGYRLAATSSLLLAFLMFGVFVNLSISQLVYPTVSALALWVAVGSTVQVASRESSRQV